MAQNIADTQEPITTPSAPAPLSPRLVRPPETRRQTRAAEDAFLSGARRLQKDDLHGAEADFTRALALSPANHDYAMALALTREHHLTELVQQSSRALQLGDQPRADTLLAEARAIDPENSIVLEHVNAALQRTQPASSNIQSGPVPLTDRSQLLAGTTQPGLHEMPVLAQTIKLAPNPGTQSFHLHADSQEVIRQVALAFGIRTAFDDSVEHRTLNFDLDNVRFDQAMGVLMTMSNTFTVPLDTTTVVVAKDDVSHRETFARQVEETIYLPGMTIEQINDLANIVRSVFEVRQATVQTGLGSLVVRAPEETIAPMNRTLTDLIDANGEVMLDLKLYTVDTTRNRNVGGTIPTQAGIYNVEAAATALVNANQTLVNQAIAQGLISATASNIDIALALIGSGLVTSTLLSSTVGFFGHGLTETGITASTNVVFTLALNSSDARAVDNLQIRVGDRQPATFRAGSRYPITTSTYSTGLSTAASAAIAGASINGVSVASLLAQYAGGSSATIPQISYEDLGITLKTTPALQKSGRISMHIDLKIEALAGSSLNGIPILANRSFTSDITVADGESALMISNMSSSESAAVTGIPGLSELPGFQAPIELNGEKDTSQLILLVTPHVVRRRSDMIMGPRSVVRAQEANN